MRLDDAVRGGTGGDTQWGWEPQVAQVQRDHAAAQERAEETTAEAQRTLERQLAEEQRRGALAEQARAEAEARTEAAEVDPPPPHAQCIRPVAMQM